MDNLADKKFLAVTSYSLKDYKLFTSSNSYDPYKKKYEIEDFKQILATTPLLEFGEALYFYLIMTCRKQDEYMDHNKQSNEKYIQDISYKEELVVTLKDLLSGGNLRVRITNLAKPHVINRKTILDLLQSASIDKLSETIRSLELNIHPLSKDLAIAEINTRSDPEWIKKWMESMGYLDPDWNSFTLEKFNDYFYKSSPLHPIPGFEDRMREAMIDEYAYDHPQEINLDNDGLNRILAKIRKEKSKSGRKEETNIIKDLAYTLSLFLRLDRYLNDKKIEKINDIDLENSDLRIIHDVICFFNLIIDYRKDAQNRKNLEKTIRKMISDFKEPSTIIDYQERLQVFKFHCLNGE
jgi:hypothetical protein